jgi:hypothetical protein
MSKIKFGAFVTDMRGKSGGSVFSKNRSGAYVKNKVTPINQKTAAQQAVRESLAQLAGQWRDLSEDQRRSWKEGSANFPLTNVFGDQYFLAGNMLYNRLNANLKKVQATPITSCPTPAEVAEVTAAINSLTTGSVKIDLPATDADTALVIRATPQLSAGINNFNSKLRDLYVVAPSTAAGTLTLTSGYEAKFGAVALGCRTGFAVYAVNVNTGQEGVPLYISGIAV